MEDDDEEAFAFFSTHPNAGREPLTEPSIAEPSADTAPAKSGGKNMKPAGETTDVQQGPAKKVNAKGAPTNCNTAKPAASTTVSGNGSLEPTL
ncbi:hypothetical protein MJO28_007396 [Puccinia striiformis f. sp. tritici]|uniref:Uncharacterized protein n=1 Tax=Puccinia striiformis f. sp. tritici TaxID=168172 RepID=A0ACC0EFU7_9BASI|nr:hypothetical protein MJO28_007396 [Puccinia striiformis f. sp. tritici]KAI7955936.1 hypothetical protein MJO29_007335 [Puccinia striiformis f. sp. tritici]